MKKNSPAAPRKTTRRAPLDEVEKVRNPVVTAPAAGPVASANGNETQLLLEAMLAFRNGNFSGRLPVGWTGVYGKIADAFNDVLAMNERRAQETARVSRLVGREGKLKQRMALSGLVGGWADEVQSLNTLMDDLVRPTIEVTRTIGAVAKGDLGQSMTLEVDGRPLEGEFLQSAQ